MKGMQEDGSDRVASLDSIEVVWVFFGFGRQKGRSLGRVSGGLFFFYLLGSFFYL